MTQQNIILDLGNTDRREENPRIVDPSLEDAVVTGTARQLNLMIADGFEHAQAALDYSNALGIKELRRNQGTPDQVYQFSNS